MTRWAIRVPQSSLSSLGALRLLPDVIACASNDCIWLCGQDRFEESDELRLRQIPGAERYQVTEENELIRQGARLPTDRLPAEQWIALHKFVVPHLETKDLREFSPSKLPLALVRDGQERPIAGLLTKLCAFAAYAETASAVRLARLKFIACAEGNIFVIGAPLPPLVGSRYWEDSGIFVAAGYIWQPAVEAPILRQTLKLNDDEIAVWHASGEWDRVSRSQFVSARRADVRATREWINQ